MESKDVERVVIAWAKKQFGRDTNVTFSKIWRQGDIWEATGEVNIRTLWGLSQKAKSFKVQVDSQETVIGYDI